MRGPIVLDRVMAVRVVAVGLSLLLSIACSAAAPREPTARPKAAPSAAEAPGGSPLVPGTFLVPNVEDSDGTPAFVHVTQADMPLVVSVGLPKTPPRHGSAKDGRRVAIEAMRAWEHAIRPALPWFRLEFAEKDPAAAVQVVWKRRIPGTWAGFGGLAYSVVAGRLEVGGRMEISTTPSVARGISDRLDLKQLELLVAHEFGHVLGLGHCFDCESAMNYSWETRERIFVSELDVRTFLALVEQSNGVRVDGEPLLALREPPSD